jgi:glutamyl-tRNA reductase
MPSPGILFVAGLSHRTAPVEMREQLALEEEKIREILGDLSGRGLLDEAMIVSTCNRVEVYGVAAVPGEARAAAFGRLGSHRGLAWRDLEPLVYTMTGDEAVLHAFRVAASLDSMILGEPQILGQVKDAFALAQSAGTAGPVLHALMSQAFASAPRPRSGGSQCPSPTPRSSWPGRSSTGSRAGPCCWSAPAR